MLEILPESIYRLFNEKYRLIILSICGILISMIVSFKSKEAKKIFDGNLSKKLPQFIQQTAYDKLQIMDAATELNDLRVPPSNHLEKLKGTRKKQYSIRINDRYRICFEWINKNIHNVEIVDYH